MPIEHHTEGPLAGMISADLLISASAARVLEQAAREMGEPLDDLLRNIIDEAAIVWENQQRRGPTITEILNWREPKP